MTNEAIITGQEIKWDGITLRIWVKREGKLPDCSAELWLDAHTIDVLGRLLIAEQARSDQYRIGFDQ